MKKLAERAGKAPAESSRPRRKLQDVGLSFEDTKPGSVPRALIDPVEEQEGALKDYQRLT